jgi:hypothetical protein
MSPLLSTTGHIADVCFINLAVLAYMGVAIAVTRLPSDYGALAVWCGGEALTFGCMTAVLHRRLGIPALQQLSDIIAPLLAATAMIGTVRAVRAVLPPDLALPLQIMELALVGALTYLGLMLLFGRQYVQPVVGMARVLWARD